MNEGKRDGNKFERTRPGRHTPSSKATTGDPGAVRLREPEAKEGVSKVVETPAASTKRRGGESKINRADQAPENQAAHEGCFDRCVRSGRPLSSRKTQANRLLSRVRERF